jgi:hypothetical protein
MLNKWWINGAPLDWRQIDRRDRSAPMARPPPQSYLLRLWREHPGAPMHATLIAVGQPEAHQHFATLEALCAFLRAQAAAEPDLNDDGNTTYCTRSESS